MSRIVQITGSTSAFRAIPAIVAVRAYSNLDTTGAKALIDNAIAGQTAEVEAHDARCAESMVAALTRIGLIAVVKVS